jgi:hypothetical protein
MVNVASNWVPWLKSFVNHLVACLFAFLFSWIAEHLTTQQAQMQHMYYHVSIVYIFHSI